MLKTTSFLFPDFENHCYSLHVVLQKLLMKQKTIDENQGHWLLSKLGKRVLRPGGRELTAKMIDALNIQSNDAVIEFAPGIGFTAKKVLKKRPSSYKGIELNEEATRNLNKKFKGTGFQFINANAGNVPLPENSANKIYGEAMLTMQADHRKREIIREAFRLLSPGGYYAIHELGLKPDNIAMEIKAEIQKALANSIHVNARPLTLTEWNLILKEEGFEVVKCLTNPMLLLEPKRVLQDEGFLRTIKIGYNYLTHPEQAKRVREMRKVFNNYYDHLNAVAIIAKKN